MLAVHGGVLWSVVAVSYQRRTGPGCDRCGRTGDRVAAGGWLHPPPWLRRAAAAAVVIPLVGFVLPHWLWVAGVPVDTIAIEEIREVSGSLWVLGAVPALGALLTLGLVRRWGRIFPSWFPVVGGRPVPRLLALIPALLVAGLLAQYGAMLTGCSSVTLLGVTDSCYDTGRDYLVHNWAFTATYPVFLAWGVTLGATAVGYHSSPAAVAPAAASAERPTARGMLLEVPRTFRTGGPT